jgi:hypothetical protein
MECGYETATAIAAIQHAASASRCSPLNSILGRPFVHYPVAMSDDYAARFRKQAEECRAQAAKAVNPIDKDAWLLLAEEWLRMASSVDARRS